MKNVFLSVFLLVVCSSRPAVASDTAAAKNPSVLIIPYKPGMHLSDSDPHIAEGSEMDMMEMRTAFRSGLLKALNKNFAEVTDVRKLQKEFVIDDSRDLSLLYHSLVFETDSVYTLKHPKKFAVKDTTIAKQKSKARKESKYINVGVHDQLLLPEFSRKYGADYFIFINELDIETHFDDCLNLALKNYRRDLKVHYSIFDRNGKQVYGDVAVAHFDSNTNDVYEIVERNFPIVSAYMLASFKRATQ